MTQDRIEQIVSAYFPDDEFSKDMIRLARLACENVERETRQDAVSAAFEMANRLSKSPRQHA